MELRQLRYFVTVAEEQHVTRAAARLLIAAPSLSQQIKALERATRLRLFERTPQGMRLTAAGEELLPVARAALAAAQEVEDTAERLGQQRSSVLRLGFLPFALTAPARRLLTEYGREQPAVTVQLRQYEWDDPSAGLLSGATDAALVRPPFTGQRRLRMVTLVRDPVLAVVAEDSPLAREPSVTRARLARERWLEADIVDDPVFAAAWYLTDLRDRSTTVLSRAGTVEEWLAEIAFGRGIDVIPAGMAEEYRRPGLAYVPVADAPPSRLCVATRREESLGAAAALVALAARHRPPRVSQPGSNRCSA